MIELKLLPKMTLSVLLLWIWTSELQLIKRKRKIKRLKKKRELVVVKNRNLNPVDPDVQATHHLMDIGTTHYNKVGNKSGNVSWGYGHD
ncbi:hypothetical protein Hanom_Chr05g00401271 [Helianthus anomalus]